VAFRPNKSVVVPSIKVTSQTDRKFRLARIWSNQELRRIAGMFSGDITNVSGGDDEDKEGAHYESYFTSKQSYCLTNYAPGAFRGFKGRDNEILLDLRGELPPELRQRFDVVFNHTTLEHIFEVQTAFANLCRLTKDILIFIVPFAQVQHENEGYKDYWRFTPTCLRTMCDASGMSVIYEAASPYDNCAIYLFVVASRNPDRWRREMPSYQPLESVGTWIGTEQKGMLSRIVAGFRRRG
jgi:hypothetical protein